jgi:hypothetical protein
MWKPFLSQSAFAPERIISLTAVVDQHCLMSAVEVSFATARKQISSANTL